MTRVYRLFVILCVFALIALLIGALSSTSSGVSNQQPQPNPGAIAPRLGGANGVSIGTPPPSGISQPPDQSGGGPIVVLASKQDVSPPLRDIPPKPVPSITGIREMPEPALTESTGQGTARPPVQDPVVQSQFGAGPSVAAALAAPAPITSWDGVSNLDGVYPPDTNGDVGPNHYVQMINLHFQIWSKSGTSLYGPAANNTLWSGFGAPCETTNDGDPIALYDSIADRWLMSQFVASTTPYGECIAISTSPDPTGSYYRYFFAFSSTVFYDYPHLAVWPDGYYMSANRFTALFQGPSAIVFDRSKMLLGQPATYQEFRLSNSYGTLLPSDLDGATLPPAGSPDFFFEIGSTALHMWKFHVDWTTPANSTLSGPTSLPVAAYNQLCPTTRSCVPQPGTSVGLDGLGDRLMHRVAYRNLGDHESLVLSHSVNVATTGVHAGVRWYEIRSPNGTPTIYQQGTYAPDAANRWLPSVAMDQSGDIMLGYSVSSSSIYPSIRYTGRLASDPLGTMPQGETTLMAGSGSQTGTASRWGDYAMMAIDPSNDCTFWYTNEYMPSTGAAPWRTRIGSFQFTSCGGVLPTPTPTNTPLPPTATPLPPTPTNTPTPISNIIINPGFESGPGAGWTEFSSGGREIINTTNPHTGSYSANECGYNSCTEYVQQTITIPSGATLTYWWYMTSSEGTSSVHDRLRVQLYSISGSLLATLRTWSNRNTSNTWSQDTLDLSAYAGQTVILRFVTTTNQTRTTSFWIDDVSAP